MFIFVDDGGVKPEVEVSSGSGVRIFPFLDGFFVQWLTLGARGDVLTWYIASTL